MITNKNIIEITNLIGSALQVSRSKIDFGREFSYDKKTKTIIIERSENWLYLVMGIAHKMMHHKQNDEKRLLINYDDAEDYAFYNFLADKDARFEWIAKNEPCEVEANGFCRLFAEFFLANMLRAGKISIAEYSMQVRQIDLILALELNEFCDKNTAKMICDKELAARDELQKRFGAHIAELLARANGLLLQC